MRAASALVFGIIWLIISMMVGYIVTANLIQNANASGALNGTAGTQWANFVTFVWIGFSILSMTPLVLVALMFMGLFGGFAGSGRGK